MQVDEKNTVRLSVDVSEDLRRRLRYAALGDQMTLREYVTTLLEERLGSNNEERSK